MRPHLVLTVLSLLTMTFLPPDPVHAQASAALHLSPAGNDADAGTPDKPLATLQRAVAAARALPAGAAKRIVVHAGSYYDVNVALTPDDSGLTIEAAPGEKPVLYGGIPLTNWQKDGNRFFAAALPQRPGQSAWLVRLLQVNGRMSSRARFPAQGTLTHESKFDVPWMSSTGGGWKRKPTEEELTTLQYKAGDVPADLDVASAEVTVYHMWDESCVGVKAHDAAGRTLALSPACGHPPGAFGVKKYVLWNIREGLTAPGQWFHDRRNNRIVYWPLPGEDMVKAQVIVPTQTTILNLRGSAERKIGNVTLRGLTLAVTNARLITGGFGAANFDGCVSLENAENCTLEGLTVTCVGGHAVNTKRACVGTRVENCEISHCGAGGLYVGGEKALVANNHVHAVGRDYPSAMGIFRGGKNCVVRHNEVHDTPYSAINYGGEGNVVEYNRLYDCMKVLHDGAAIYMFAAKNCILRGNYAFDIPDTGGYGSSAYYLDERSEGSIVEGNLSVNVARPSHNHMCGANTIRNNVFIVQGDAKITLPRSSGFTLEGNVLYATGKIRIEGVNNIATWSKNVFYSGAGKFEGVNLKDYGKSGDAPPPWGDTVFADPLFVDLGNGDYRYKPDSPAAKLGLQPIDASKAGRQK